MMEYLNKKTAEISKNNQNFINDSEEAFNKLQLRTIDCEKRLKTFEKIILENKNTEGEEVKNIRELLKEKVQQDQKVFSKEKEKSKVLFNEVIRIGEGQDSYIKTMNENHLIYEERL